MVFLHNIWPEPFRRWLFRGKRLYIRKFGMETIPKKLKLFIWELSNLCLNTQDKLQHRSPRISLSPSCCIMSTHDPKTHSHLFISCSFSGSFWAFISSSEFWVVVDFTYKSTSLSNIILLGHPFKNEDSLAQFHTSLFVVFMAQEEFAHLLRYTTWF